MCHNLVTLSLALLMLVPSSSRLVAQVTPASSASATAKRSDMLKAPCGAADKVMMGAMKDMQKEMPAESGDLDKDFAAGAVMQSKLMMEAASLEIRCGKNAKAKRAAEDFIQSQQVQQLTGALNRAF
jgi:predicted outer membrane protein